VPPAAVLAVGAPIGTLARPPNSGARALAAPACAASGSGSGGVVYPGAPSRAGVTFTDAGATFTLTRSDGARLAWTSTAPIAAVLVRGAGVVQPWPAGGARSGHGVSAPSDGTTVAPIDDVTFCFADPPAPTPEPVRPLVLSLETRGTFTRVPPAVDVTGTVTISNPNKTSVPLAGLDVRPSTVGSCVLVVPQVVPAGETPVSFRCGLDIAAAARQGEVDVVVQSGSARGDARSTVVWVERVSVPVVH
jgi:hypothetical protein